ncbi:MAG: hypothetical protein U0Q16_08115 [Bryobacteraceae bacterium]
MWRGLIASIMTASLFGAGAIKLYLTDGTFHSVREYEVKKDRVRYYSTERGEFEEIPLELVDLKRTKAEQQEIDDSRKADAEANKAEDKAVREMRREAARVPAEAGLYWIDGAELKPIKAAESKVHTNKRRSVLKALSPIPMVTGKATLELDGEASQNVMAQERPEFYIRLSTDERFGIVKLTPQKGVRIVERWTIEPVTKTVLQEHDDVDIFRYQSEDGLYKIWAQKPMSPGEYAVIQYTEGKQNVQVWDFAVKAK